MLSLAGHKSPTQKAAARGMTLVETLIGVGVASMVMLGVVGTFIATARTIQKTYGPAQSRSDRMAALNEIRFRLADARSGSFVISPDGHRIDFQDPNLGPNITSALWFRTEVKSLYYDDNINQDPGFTKLVTGLFDVNFAAGSPDYTEATSTTVTVAVRTSSELAYSNVDVRDGITVVYLQNK